MLSRLAGACRPSLVMMPWIIALWTVFVVTPALADGRPSASELLRASDRARGGLADGITWNVSLETTEDGNRTSKSFVVKARGDDALVETTAPPRSKGEVLLFNNRAIWYYKPGLRMK